MSVVSNPRAITEAERPFLENLTLDDLDYLHDVLVPRIGERQAGGLTMWLRELSRGRVTRSPTTRAKYRKILAELYEETLPPRRRRRNQKGAAEPGTALAGAILAASALAASTGQISASAAILATGLVLRNVAYGRNPRARVTRGRAASSTQASAAW